MKTGRRIGGEVQPQTCGSAGSSPAGPTNSKLREKLRRLDRKISAIDSRLRLDAVLRVEDPRAKKERAMRDAARKEIRMQLKQRAH